MKNELIETTIKTNVGMLPTILNKNNEYIKEEFDRIVSENDKMVLDVDCNTVTAHNAAFKNLSIDGTTLNSLTLQRYSAIDSSISEIREALESINLLSEPTPATYGASASDEQYDMTQFFSTASKGILFNMSVNDLCNKKIFRMVEDFMIPLQIGTMLSQGTFKMVVYHDNIDIAKDGSKIVQRIFVPITNSKDGKNIIQNGSAESVVL